MTDAELPAGQPAPDANVSQSTDQNADAEGQKSGNEADSSTAVNDTDEIANRAKGVGKRIDELTRNWRNTERDRDYWRELAMKSQRPEPEPQRPAPAPAQAKTLADFGYDEAQYQTYMREDMARAAREQVRAELAQERERQESQRRQSSFTQRESDFSKTVEDYHEVTRNPRLPITQHIAEVVAESDEGPALAYYLGKNIDVAERIAQLPPLAAARELGRIEARLVVEREKAKEKPLVSKAPPPTPKIDAAEPGIEKDPDKMSTDEWVKWREKQLSRKRK